MCASLQFYFVKFVWHFYYIMYLFLFLYLRYLSTAPNTHITDAQITNIIKHTEWTEKNHIKINVSIKGKEGKKKKRGEEWWERKSPRTKAEEPNLSNHINVRLSYTVPTYLCMSFHETRIRPLSSAQRQAFLDPLSANHIVRALYIRARSHPWVVKNCVPTISAVCGKACALAQVAMESTL